MCMPSFYELVIKSSTRMIPEVWKNKTIFQVKTELPKKGTTYPYYIEKYLKITGKIIEKRIHLRIQ